MHDVISRKNCLQVAGASRFEVISSSNDAYFTIDSDSGVMRTETRLDYERHPVVVVNIRYQTSDGNGQFGHVQAVVELTDVNDNAPEFVSRRAMASVPEDFPVGKVIYVCKADDPDSGNDGEMTYSLRRNAYDQQDQLFAVDR